MAIKQDLQEEIKQHNKDNHKDDCLSMIEFVVDIKTAGKWVSFVDEMNNQSNPLSLEEWISDACNKYLSSKALLPQKDQPTQKKVPIFYSEYTLNKTALGKAAQKENKTLQGLIIDICNKEIDAKHT